MKCVYCERDIKNAGSLKAHEMACSANPDKIKHKTGLPKGFKHTKSSPRKGLKYEDIYGVDRSSELKRKASVSCSERGTIWSKMSDTSKSEFKAKRKADMLKRYESGWESTAGRCKKIKIYNKSKQQDVLVDGSWEEIVVNSLNNSDLIWDRNKKRFPYKNEYNKDSHYTPDFYIETLDCFIEVKGYETTKDRCKWEQFPHNLRVFRKSDILKLKNELTFKDVYDNVETKFNGS